MREANIVDVSHGWLLSINTWVTDVGIRVCLLFPQFTHSLYSSNDEASPRNDVLRLHNCDCGEYLKDGALTSSQ
jgi:hypothetical protein